MKKFNIFKNFVYAKKKGIILCDENYVRGTYKKNWKSNVITINKNRDLGLFGIYEENKEYYLCYVIDGRYSEDKLGDFLGNVEFNDYEKTMTLYAKIDEVHSTFKIKFNYDEFKQDIYCYLAIAQSRWSVF